MRSIRNAAVAGAAAIALALGSTTVAVAQDSSQEETTQSSTSSTTSSNTDASLSSKINTGLGLDGDEAADGQNIFGSSKDLDGEPTWAKVLYAFSVIGTIGTALGVIVGPIYNFFVHGPQA